MYLYRVKNSFLGFIFSAVVGFLVFVFFGAIVRCSSVGCEDFQSFLQNAIGFVFPAFFISAVLSILILPFLAGALEWYGILTLFKFSSIASVVTVIGFSLLVFLGNQSNLIFQSAGLQFTFVIFLGGIFSSWAYWFAGVGLVD